MQRIVTAPDCPQFYSRALKRNGTLVSYCATEGFTTGGNHISRLDVCQATPVSCRRDVDIRNGTGFFWKASCRWVDQLQILAEPDSECSFKVPWQWLSPSCAVISCAT